MQTITFKDVLFNYMKRHPVTFSLLAANFIMFIVVAFNGGYDANTLVLTLINNGALVPLFVSQGEFWRIFTAMFLHAGFLHFFMNSFFLYYIGGSMERIIGSLKYAILYFVSGIGSGIAVWLLSSPTVPVVGASGALYGIMAGLFLLTFIRSTWFHPRTIRSIRFMVAINVFFTLTSMISNGSISVWGHAGGFIIGLITLYIMMPKQPYQSNRGAPYQQRPSSHHGRTVIDADSVTDDDIYDSYYSN